MQSCHYRSVFFTHWKDWEWQPHLKWMQGDKVINCKCYCWHRCIYCHCDNSRQQNESLSLYDHIKAVHSWPLVLQTSTTCCQVFIIIIILSSVSILRSKQILKRSWKCDYVERCFDTLLVVKSYTLTAVSVHANHKMTIRIPRAWS